MTVKSRVPCLDPDCDYPTCGCIVRVTGPGGSDAALVREALTLDEIRAWCEKYASTPWNGLALATAAARDPSPLVVLKSAVTLAAAAAERADDWKLHSETLSRLLDEARAALLAAQQECERVQVAAEVAVDEAQARRRDAEEELADAEATITRLQAIPSAIRPALESLGELIWSGKPVGDQATCSTCGGHWPRHEDGCFIGDAMIALFAVAERMDAALAPDAAPREAE